MPGQHQVDQQQGQAECQVDLTADDLLLVRHRRPFIAGPRRQGFDGDLFHQRHRLAGAVARGRQADHRGGWIEIIQADERRSYRRRDFRHRAERDHVAVLVAHGQALDLLRRQAKFRVGLDIDLEDTAELVELVDVGRTRIR